MKKIILAYILLLVSAASISAALPDVVPTANATHVDPEVNISINFSSLDINPATLNNTTIKIHGSEASYSFASIQYEASTHTVTLTADKHFRPGEQISVIVTSKVKINANSALDPFFWTFTIASQKGTFDFFREDISRIGKTFSSVDAADLDNDQDIDLSAVLTNSRTISLLRNDSHGLFTAETVTEDPFFYGFSAVADFDSDGFPDLVAGKRDHDNDFSGLQFFSNNQGMLEKTYDMDLGNQLRFITAFDFDLDGDIDLAATVQGAENLVMLKNNNGSISIGQQLYGFYQPQSITAADFDNDGLPEIILADASQNMIHFLENDGTGQFSSDYSFSVAENPYYCSSGDLNHDGYTDLVITHFNTSKVSVYFNDGNKQFEHVQTIDVGTSPRFVKIADINADQQPDLLVPCWEEDRLDIIKNQDGSSFALIKSVALSKGAAHLATTDIDNDGDLDIAVAATGYSPSLSDLILLRNQETAPDILLNNYDLDFGTVAIGSSKDISVQIRNISAQNSLEITGITAGNAAFHADKQAIVLSAGDFQDLTVTFKPGQAIPYTDNLTLFTNDPDQPRIDIKLGGQGDNRFSPLPNVPDARENQIIKFTVNEKIDPATLQTNTINVRGSHSGLHTFEVDYEEELDRISLFSSENYKFGETVRITVTDRIKNSSGSSIQPFSWSFGIRTLNGNGRFNLPQTIEPGNNYMTALEGTEIADFNGDGLLDILSVSDWSHTIVLYLNNGDRTYKNRGQITHRRGNLLRCVDIDNDFDIDIVIAGSNKVSFLTNDGQAYFSPSDSVIINYDRGINVFMTEDFNNDGWLDFATKETHESVIHFYLNDGNMNFSNYGSLNLSAYGMLNSSMDFDSDGDNDLIYFDDLKLFFLENVNGSFAIKKRIDTYFRPDHVSIADFNKDSHIDIAVLGKEDDENVIRIFFNNGSGDFSASDVWSYWNLFKASGLAHGDWDSDGDIDFAITGNQTYSSNQSFMLLANNGDGSFTPTHTSYPAKFIEKVQAADFDNNGNMDLLMIVNDEQKHRLRIMYGEEEITDIADASPLIRTFKLHQNYPNPFNPETIINYELPARSAGGGITNFVKLTVLDITGREVATLVNKQLPAGKHSVTFNANNLASGVYFYHIRMGNYQETRKMLLLR